MNPELVSQIASALVIAWGVFTAVRATRAASRATLLSGLLNALAMVLLVRLIADFEGWTSWFIYTWLMCLAGYVSAAYMAATVWPSIQWRSDKPTVRASEMTGLGVASVLVLAVSASLVVPGLLIS